MLCNIGVSRVHQSRFDVITFELFFDTDRERKGEAAMKVDEDGDEADEFIMCDSPPPASKSPEENTEGLLGALRGRTRETYGELYASTFAWREELKRRGEEIFAQLLARMCAPVRLASDLLAKVIVAVQVMLVSMRNAAPGLGNMPDQNQTDANKARIGATGGRKLDPSRGLKYHDPPESGVRDIVSSPEHFGNVSRGDPLPSKLSKAAQVAAGLTPETWRLKVEIDPFLQKHHVKRAAEAELETMVLDLPSLKAIGERCGTGTVVFPLRWPVAQHVVRGWARGTLIFRTASPDLSYRCCCSFQSST